MCVCVCVYVYVSARGAAGMWCDVREIIALCVMSDGVHRCEWNQAVRKWTKALENGHYRPLSHILNSNIALVVEWLKWLLW